MVPDDSSVLMRAAIDFAVTAIRSVILINGGAAVALMTFIGHRDSAASSGFYWPLFWFAMGVVAGTICGGLSYLAQVVFAEHDGNSPTYTGIFLRILAIVAFFSSTGMFVVGVFMARFGFSITS